MITPLNSVYSVTRKLDLASLLVFTACYGFLFAFMNLLKFGPWAFAVVAGFFTSVGVSQAVLFGGKAPRLASCVVGAIYFAFSILDPFRVAGGHLRILLDAPAVLVFSIFGIFFGYCAGACLGGVFLVINYLRNRIHAERGLDSELHREISEKEG